MSLHISVVSLEGNHLDEIAAVLADCDYRIEDSFVVSSAHSAANELDWRPSRDRLAKVAYCAKGWTHIIDPELVLMMDHDVWRTYSRRWNNVVVGWVCEGISGSYGLVVFDRGQKIREVLAVSGELEVDDGSRLPEEVHIDWASVSEDDLLQLIRDIGPKADMDEDRDYLVLHLDESRPQPTE